jgi:polyphosphate kinase
MKSIFSLTENFINRELSWLEFNSRVLEEAQDSENPLFERLKFISIVSSNLDEFFMVRVASLWQLIDAGIHRVDISGMTIKEQLDEISLSVHKQVRDQYRSFHRSIEPALNKENIFFLSSLLLNDKQKNFLHHYYINNIYPVLTPMVVDQSRPFPLIMNKSLNIGLLLKADKRTEDLLFGTIQVPSVLSRYVEIPSNDSGRYFILLEEIIKMNLEDLFNGYKIECSSCFRITRNADINLGEDEREDLLETIEQSIKKRKWGAVVRLEIEKGANEKLISILEEELEITKKEKYEVKGPIDFTFLMKLSNLQGFEKLKFEKIKPQVPRELLNEDNIFEAIAKRDILLHHPYDSFEPIIHLIQQASEDPEVLAIKQTLYRVSGNSPLVEALAEAAENGKQVTVLVELKARFDEENNINWAKRLERAGCHVIYGVVGLKTHCKLLLIVRREPDGIRRYVHMGTGNYNDITAKIYTDLGLLTANPHFGADASSFFNLLSGHSEPKSLHKFSYAPVNLRKTFLYHIDRETKNALMGKEAKIIAKLNSLVDMEIIAALYEASCAGVNIELIVRGICCLRPGIKGVSENISVRSIVGRFLEHTRIFYFHNGGEEDIYLSSADWMNRNLDRRIELLFPIEEARLKAKVREILNACLKDTVKARLLKSDGSYMRIDKRGKVSVNSQEYLYELAVKEQFRYKLPQVELKKISIKPIMGHGNRGRVPIVP